MAPLRYIVDDVETSVALDTEHLCFELIEQCSPAVDQMRTTGMSLRARGGQQTLCVDPSRNVVALFLPA